MKKQTLKLNLTHKLMQEVMDAAVIVGTCPWDMSRLKEILEKKMSFKVFEEALNVKQTLELVNELSDIEFVLSELELKTEDGLELATVLINRYKMNVAVVSRLLRHSSDMLLKELATMNVRLISPMPVTIREIERFVQAVKNISCNNINTITILPKTLHLKIERLGRKINGEVFVIGGSTGALKALYQLLRNIEIGDEQALVICLHTVKSHNVVKKMESIVKRNVIEVSDVKKFELGNVYVLRSGKNYKLIVKDGELFLRGFRERLGLGYRPSINLVMENFSAVFGERCTGIVLSGYGNDGVLGSKLIVLRGGKIIVQDPETAEIPLMPRFVKETIDSLGKECEIIKL